MSFIIPLFHILIFLDIFQLLSTKSFLPNSVILNNHFIIMLILIIVIMYPMIQLPIYILPMIYIPEIILKVTLFMYANMQINIHLFNL